MGRRETQTAILFLALVLYCTVKSNSSRRSLQRASLPLKSIRFIIHLDVIGVQLNTGPFQAWSECWYRPDSDETLLLYHPVVTLGFHQRTTPGLDTVSNSIWIHLTQGTSQLVVARVRVNRIFQVTLRKLRTGGDESASLSNAKYLCFVNRTELRSLELL